MSESWKGADRPRLRLLGGVRLTGPGGSRLDLTSRRARGLLAYLYLARDQAASRQQLCGLLWSDRGEAQARASLRKCLMRLREDLSSLAKPILEAGRDRIALCAGGIDCDLAELRAALDDESTCAPITDLLERLGQAQLLEGLDVPGLFDDWLAQTRGEFDRSLATRVQARLAGLRGEGRWTEVRAMAQAWLAREPLDELVVADALRAEIALGAPAAAHRRFEALKAALAAEYGARPGAAVRGAMALLDAPEPPDGPPPPSSAQETEAAASAARAAEPRFPGLGEGRPTLAVLSFEQQPADPDRAYLGQAIAEDIADALTKLRWLFVLSPRSSLAYQPVSAPLAQIRRELGVRYAVAGKIITHDARLILRLSLSDCLLGDTIWAKAFATPLARVFDAASDIVTTVAGALEPALLRREEDIVRRAEPKNPRHWDLFVRGRWCFWRLTYRNIERSQALFTEALAIEPDDAGSLAFLAFTHCVQLWSGWTRDPAASLAEAMRCSGRAVTSAPDDAFAHYAHGAVWSLRGDLDRACAEQRLALEINPNLAGAIGELGRYHAFRGEYDEALACFARALRISPCDPQRFLWLRHKGMAAFVANRAAEAVDFAKDAVACRPDVGFNHYLLAACLAANGELDEGRKAFAEARRLLAVYSTDTLRFSNPFGRPADLRRYTEALALCGWPG